MRRILKNTSISITPTSTSLAPYPLMAFNNYRSTFVYCVGLLYVCLWNPDSAAAWCWLALHHCRLVAHFTCCLV